MDILMDILILLILIGMGLFLFIEFILSRYKYEIGEQLHRKWSDIFENRRNKHK